MYNLAYKPRAVFITNENVDLLVKRNEVEVDDFLDTGKFYVVIPDFDEFIVDRNYFFDTFEFVDKSEKSDNFRRIQLTSKAFNEPDVFVDKFINFMRTPKPIVDSRLVSVD